MKDIKVFEEIRKDLTKNGDLKIPMSYVFGRGVIEGNKSFGNTSLQINSQKVDDALNNMQDLQHIWNRSHTQWTWKHLNLSHFSSENNMRQIAAEIASRKAALNDAKWQYVENEIQLKKLQEKLQEENLSYWDEVETKVKIAKLKEGMLEGSYYVEGAMKDILTLNALFEQLKNKISNFSEYDIEREEIRSHLKRSITQCIRDVRETGSITKGEQEYLEQIGVNPTKMQILLRQYVEDEAKIDAWDVSLLHSFVDSIADNLIKVHSVDKIKMEEQGFSVDPIEEFSYQERVALSDK